MVKKIFLTAAVAGLLMGATVVAKATYPHDRAMRKAYRKACKAAFKTWWPHYWARHHH